MSGLALPPAETLDRLIEYHRSISEAEIQLSRSLAALAERDAAIERRNGGDVYSTGSQIASDRNRTRARWSAVTADSLLALRDFAYPPAPERLHPDRPKKVFTGHLKRPEDTSAGLRFPP
ncbi:hypothetical protein [Methylobacterium sp. Leaf85]|uniref:hypothetical protein n=1 Tax=Methylobacterium sp. Leaf85 TaxID=1736241 RepID=UPI0006F398E4|nr:hypothetical protein [Methylobacterium sp. Leaf85]KQO43060.1 hypothetical protein ASF08_10820 [Methylobacterium sp. Leaf85]